MSLLTILLSPFNILFFTIISGILIGKIRIQSVSLGIAGILFASIFVGFLLDLLIPESHIELITTTESTMKILSKLGSSLFVSVIGLQTGFSIKSNSKGSLTAFFIGAFMSISGVIIMLLVSVLDKAISYPSLLGILCGALTSTPGLSSVCELMDVGSGQAIWGYSCSYLWGVILTVLFAQIFNVKGTCKEITLSDIINRKTKAFSELLLICLTSLLGNIIGSIHIPIICISAGGTACTLFIGLIVGYILQKKFSSVKISSQVLNAFRNLGLALFFVGTGFTTGIQSISFNIKSVIYGASITLSTILCGLFLCRIIFSKHHLNTSYTIAGGMTSSPAYGAISTSTNESSENHFSFAYLGSLITLVFLIQIISR